MINDIIELTDFCFQYSKKKKKKISFEIGTEEPSCFTGTPNQLNELVDEIINQLRLNKLPNPLFVVLQTGTRVKELSNVGLLNNINLIKKNSYKISKISKICKKNNFFLKQHNTDYLKYDVLRKLPNLNIDAVNVAPEFGYVESKELYNILKKYKKDKLLEQFLEISYNSKKWEKWLKKKSKLTDLDKSLLAGHYIFGTKIFKELKKEIQSSLPTSINLDQYLIRAIKNKILYYMKCFNYF